MSAGVATVIQMHPEQASASVSYETDRPTEAQYAAFVHMFSHFNENLFDGALPQPILTFSRRPRAFGFFAPDRWAARADETRMVSEIAVNPDQLKSEPPIEIASTLVHEACHLWQHVFGKASRAGYHNMEWSKKMESVGLMPSSTGEPGGKRVGQKMSDYVIAGGRFAEAFAMMPDEWFFPFVSQAPDGKKPSGADCSKSKFKCPTCGDIARGKPTLMIDCRKCRVPMVLERPNSQSGEAVNSET
jgi:hypothetical protein